MTEQENKLGQDLLEEARTRARQILEQSEKEAQKIAKAAQEHRDRLQRESLEEAELTVAREIRVRRAVQEMEKRRRRLMEEETLVLQVLDGAERQASNLQGEPRRLSLQERVNEAAAAVGNGDLVIRIRPEDLALIGESTLINLAAKDAGMADAPSISVLADTTVTDGVIVETRDGKRRFDNTLSARRARLDKNLRLRVALALDAETKHA